VYRSAVGLNLIDSPVVSRVGNKAIRIRISKKANNEIRPSLIAPERAASTGLHISEILTEVDIV
jgi:hypothetical protein